VVKFVTSFSPAPLKFFLPHFFLAPHCVTAVKPAAEFPPVSGPQPSPVQPNLRAIKLPPNAPPRKVTGTSALITKEADGLNIIFAPR